MIFRILPVALVGLTACTTFVEEQASQQYAPVFPIAETQTRLGLATGSIYNQVQPGLFAADRRASRVGDILTISFTERFSATKSQGASAAKSDSFSVDIPDAVSNGINDASLTGGTAQDFSGSGSASQTNTFSGMMSVHVVRILPRGNLEILGEKKLTLNNGDEYIRVRGIVRPEDISSDNIVMSDRIANAEIKYTGAGDVADTARQGWLRRVFNVVSPI